MNGGKAEYYSLAASWLAKARTAYRALGSEEEMTVTLTDQEYQLLALEASKSGKQPEMLLRDMIRGLQASSIEQHLMTGRELAEKLYREGKLAGLATQRSLSKKEQEERERLVQQLAGGKPTSEMVIEDRGSY